MSKNPQYIVIKQNELKEYLEQDLKCDPNLTLTEACSLASALNTGALAGERFYASTVDEVYHTDNNWSVSDMWCVLKQYN